MRRFNLTNPAAAGDADKEAARETKAASPSRTRLLLLILVLVVVVAFGTRDFIGRYVGRGVDKLASLPERIVTPPADRSAGLSSAPSTSAPVVASEHSASVPGAKETPQTDLKLTSPLPEAEREPLSGRTLEPQGSSRPRAAKGAPRGRFSLQVGAMAREANARTLRQRLEKLGYRSTIRKGDVSVTQHVVLVAASGDKSEADALTERLKMEGISATAAESDGGYRVEAGRSILLDEAIDLARDLQKKGLATKIVSETVTTTLYRVRVGEFMNRSEARQTGQELRQKGFPVFIVKK